MNPWFRIHFKEIKLAKNQYSSNKTMDLVSSSPEILSDDLWKKT
jgi:hypothetical protein